MSNSPTRHNASPSPLIAAMPPDELRAHMSRLGQRGNAGRVTLAADEVAALAAAYQLLDKIHARHSAKLDKHIGGEAPDGS
ncbi:hypothetical protein BH23CHL2_BH23CHL2_24940 [soil metagenome]